MALTGPSSSVSFKDSRDPPSVRNLKFRAISYRELTVSESLQPLLEMGRKLHLLAH